MSVSLSVDDLVPFAPDIDEVKAEEMIIDAMAMAKLVAPCLADDDLDEDLAAAAKAIIRGAILRWNDSGSGANAQLTALGFSQTLDTRTQRRSMYWPSEIESLQKICAQALGAAVEDKAWGYDTFGNYSPVVHADTCSLVFGALYCSCGAELAQGYPLWETEGV